MAIVKVKVIKEGLGYNINAETTMDERHAVPLEKSKMVEILGDKKAPVVSDKLAPGKKS